MNLSLVNMHAHWNDSERGEGVGERGEGKERGRKKMKKKHEGRRE